MNLEPLMSELARAFADRQLFLVGGCLRDQLLGRAVSDLDFATDCTPEETRARVESWADSVWLVGERFGTIGLQHNHIKAEITTFRADEYDGLSRKPEVNFGRTIEEDLARRDFTINAMARNVHTGELLDPYGGRDDLDAKLVRFVGDPAARIREDPLRMLRAVRFCAQLGFELELASAAGIAALAGELRRISWERLRDELDGMLLSPRPEEAIRLCLDLELAGHFLPELLHLDLPQPARHHIKGVLDHTLDTLRLVPADKTLRYAALLHDIAKPQTFSSDTTGIHFYRHEYLGAVQARAILTRLHQPASLVQHVETLVLNHLRIPFYSGEWNDGAVRRLMFDLGELLESALALADADVQASDPADLPEFRARMANLRARIQQLGEATEIARMKPLLNGDEVMALLGIGPGPRVGEILDFLLQEQIEGHLTTRHQAVEAAHKYFVDSVQL